MLDSQLIPFFGSQIETAVLSAYPNIGDVEVIQAAQPTQQGTPTVPTLMFIKLPDRRSGWPMTKTGRIAGVFTESVIQLFESTFQVSALSWQDPSKPNDQVVTASDLLNQVLMYFTMPSVMRSWREQNLGILRVRDVTNESFENDQHQFEFYPTFQLVFTHQREFANKAELITMIDGEIHRV